MGGGWGRFHKNVIKMTQVLVLRSLVEFGCRATHVQFIKATVCGLLATAMAGLVVGATAEKQEEAGYGS